MKKSNAFAQIGAMKGIVKITDIIDIILKIDNFKSDTISKLTKAKPYEGENLVSLSDIYVDLDYQRKLKIQTILNRLLEYGGFDKSVAGHIDLAERPDKRKFVWDGFHRTIKAGIAGLSEIQASFFEHDRNMSDDECKKAEAKKFKVRNADSTKMQPDEIFKASVVFRDPIALQQLEVLKKCKIDVAGTNDDTDAYSLGGFGVFNKHWNSVGERILLEASNIIRRAYSSKTISVYLLFGFALLLEKNDSELNDSTASVFTIGEKFKEMILDAKGNEIPQKTFSTNVLKHQTIPSVSRNLLRMGLEEVYNDNGKEVEKLIKSFGIDDEELFEDE